VEKLLIRGFLERET